MAVAAALMIFRLSRAACRAARRASERPGSLGQSDDSADHDQCQAPSQAVPAAAAGPAAAGRAQQRTRYAGLDDSMPVTRIIMIMTRMMTSLSDH
jgi:hypothetical protein